jgi:hypothetical protein
MSAPFVIRFNATLKTNYEQLIRAEKVQIRPQQQSWKSSSSLQTREKKEEDGDLSWLDLRG